MVRARMRLFEQALRERGLKSTAQRDDIAKVFFASSEHLSVEELHAAVKKVNPRVGYATVYRTLKLLKEIGLADERHFDDGQARYEPTEAQEQHHDHIICQRCGKIVEFNSEELEKLQERIARSRVRRAVTGWSLRHLRQVPEGRRSTGRTQRASSGSRTPHRLTAGGSGRGRKFLL